MPPPLSPEPNLEGIVNSGWDKVGRVADTTAHHTSTRDLFRESEKTEKHKVTRIRNREMQKVGWVIDPRKSRILPKWDLLMVSALLFTALVTPVEVAFLEEGQYPQGKHQAGC